MSTRPIVWTDAPGFAFTPDEYGNLSCAYSTVDLTHAYMARELLAMLQDEELNNVLWFWEHNED